MRDFILYLRLFITSTAVFVAPAAGISGPTVQKHNFSFAKTFLVKNVELFDSKTTYCSCSIIATPEKKAASWQVDLESCGYKVQKNSKRAARLEWEHVVPAEAFGQSFKEWREGSPLCVKRGKPFKGRKCAGKNEEFNKMEGDLYNLFPEIGELNGLRSNYSMAQISGDIGRFGKCAVKIADRKFEPQDLAKGIVARTYINFEKRYPGRGVISNKNEKLFEAWNKMYPLTPLECRRWRAIEPVQGYKHHFVASCPALPASPTVSP